MKRLLRQSQINNLIIRYAKRSKKNPAILRRIANEMYGRVGVDDDEIKLMLIDFLDGHKLVTDWKRFLLNLNPKKDTWFDGKVKSHHDTIIDNALEIIKYTNVDLFPDYQAPAYYRNFKKKQADKN
jgi:hypothetical protein